MRRMFVAVNVNPEPELIALCAGAMRHFAGEEFRWTPTQQFHITLKFLGEVSEGQLDSLCESIRAAVSSHFVFTFPLLGVGLFGSRYDPRVLWAGATQSPELQELGEAVLEAAATSGFPRERLPFVPHLTLARIASVRDKNRLSKWVGHHRNLWIQSCRVTEVILFESMLKPGGAIHLPHATFGLHDGSPTPENHASP